MNLSGLGWQQLPWIQATAGQWRYAVRNATAMCLALSIAYGLQLDEPYWAMTSAAVVSFPTAGGVISKSLGRIAGSMPGALAALIISGQTLNDPWLFTISIASWLALCTWISNHYQNNVAYAFSLAGYTAAIIAFTSVNVVEIESIWTIAQARVCEVISGILCGALMMMVLPSTSDGDTLIQSLKEMHVKLLDHTILLLQRDSNDGMRHAHENVIGQILTMNLLRMQAFWSHYRFRRQNNVLNYVLHQQLRLTSVISSLRRMLLTWEDAPDSLLTAMHQLLAELAHDDADKYRLAQILRSAVPADDTDYRHRAFCGRLRYFCWLYLNVSRWLRRCERADGQTYLAPPRVPALARKADGAEAGWNALRTFSVIILGCSFWITTDWDSGASALTLAAISCVLYSSALSPTSSVLLLLKTLGLLAIFSFVMKFGFMVQVNWLWQFIIVLFPLLLTMQLFKLQQKKRAALWGQLIVFMGSFLAVTNPPTYDFQSFINDNLAKICGVTLVWLAFHILRPSSDQRRSRRHIRAMRREFIDQLTKRPHLSQSSFESLIYHRINQLNSGGDDRARMWLLRWGVVLLNCSHIAWQLREWDPPSPELDKTRVDVISDLQNIVGESGVRHLSLDDALETLQRRIERLSSSHGENELVLAGIIWRLYCSLYPLKSA